jgi:hypothetical protein
VTEVLDGMPDGTIGAEALGEVTADDYERVLMPAFEAARAQQEHVNVVFVAGDRFTGFTSGALWDDTKFGFRHLKGWGRVAIVTDVDWMTHLVHAFSWLAPKGMQVFPARELEAAKARAAA